MSLFIPAALVGLGGALVMPDIDVPDRIFPEMLFAYAPAWLRITSYNVCYTKLLRIGLVSCLVPTRRIVRVEVSEALRAEG